MSGVIDPRGDQSSPHDARSQTPRALVDLAESLRHVGASDAVEWALDQAWHDMHRDHPAADAGGPTRRPMPLWAWPVLGAAAAIALALRLGPATPGPASAPVEPEAVVAAVPGGPLEPPPPRVPEADAAAVRPTRTGQRTDNRPNGPSSSRETSASGTSPGRASVGRNPPVATAPAPAAAGDEVEPFVWIRGADEIEPGLGLQIVRVQLPRLRWDTVTPRREFVNADVLMGNDGQPRAVRVVRTNLR